MANEFKNQDLGLGDKVIEENRARFLNKDGSFNVYRKGMWERGAFSIYHAILSASWPKFFMWVVGYYVFVNILFSIMYFLSGVSAFPEIATLEATDRFGQLFFYSVQVISTLGSSPLHPTNTPAQIFLALESMIGLFGFALATGIMFARFSNPATKIIFSEKAAIAPYKEITGFMVRVINGRSNEFIQVSAILTLAMDDKKGVRTFQVLPLERESVLVFPLSWTIVHPINLESPIFGMSLGDLKKYHAEFLLTITATDQDLSKTVYARDSFTAEEVTTEKKFSYIIERDSEGRVFVDPKRIGEMEKYTSF